MFVLLKMIDLMASSIAAVPLVFYIIIKSIFSKKSTKVPEVRKMLILDMSYTLEIVRKRQLQAAITSRDLGGYFSHVWNVHPCSTVIQPEREQDRYGKFSSTSLTSKLTFVEGKIGRFETLKSFPALNFILAQMDIFIYLNSLIDKEKITIIRAGDPYYLGPFGLSLSWMHKIPCALRIALNYDTFYEMTGHLAFPRLLRKRWVEKIIERFTLRRADLVAGGNQDGLNFALNNGARKECSTVFRVGNLIHAAHFQPPEARPGAEDKLRGLGLVGKNFSITISRLEPLKHVDDVIRGLAEVRKLGFDLYALLVGDGKMKEELIDLAELLGMTDYVVFAGNRSQEWMASVLPGASVVISPFMGRGLTEASLSGVPVVAYDIEWQGEIIKTGETGELIEYRNWKAMADAAIKFLLDEDYAKRIGDNARSNVLEMMDPEKLSRHERNEYDKLFARFYLEGNILKTEKFLSDK
jgi:glycosyltransferase involved in cell wall biosynthesis